ncbi:uncharacterized protein LOC106648412 [Trichogramma pretiosum]|uniref:uncharacterized protein LOC106648412 n=1 Tax=Trichogramma pretiosum TaxID=7493 RepID=UPI0006C9B194|nr:uncharacterized protein LOC106648412 [Trichogramma pretiosum]
MATLFDAPYLSHRLRQIEEHYEERTAFGRCDCTSYSYFAVSMVLFTIGTTITILALGDVVDGHVFSHLGHMWLVGPIFICSGLMVAVKCMLYLRRKSVIQMIFHQRQLFRHIHDFNNYRAPHDGLTSSGTGTPGPPPYEVIAQAQQVGQAGEIPPPTYAEAVALLQQAGIHDAKPCTTADLRPDALIQAGKP